MPQFSQNFDADFDAAVAGIIPGYAGPPYALARWADGEAAVAFGREHRAKSDGWRWPRGQRTLLSDALLDSLSYSAPDWHVGVTAESHHPTEHVELLRYVGVPLDRVTFAEIFIFANYRRFQRLDLAHCLVAGPGGDFHVPPDAVEREWLWHDLADKMIAEAGGPILVAAGPIANVLIYEYWRRSAACPERRQVILDVGSVMARRLHGKRTRQYQRPGSELGDWRPEWKLSKPTS